jgi:predicted nucleotidyltransferase
MRPTSICPDVDNQQRWQCGLAVAEAAAQILRRQFSAEKIVLFGSWLTPGLLRRQSDIDLAVWGLADQGYAQAVRAVSSLSSTVAIDLVQVESAQPSLQWVIAQRGVVLSAHGQTLDVDQLHHKLLQDGVQAGRTGQSRATYRVLLGQLGQELDAIAQLVQKNQALLHKLKATGDADYMGSVALNLHSFYGGAERMFKQIAQTVDGSVPDAADWHRQLLRQMAAPVWQTRSAVLRSATVMQLEEYCSFRHLVRNIYSVNLRLDRVEALAAPLPDCFAQLEADLRQFIAAIAEDDQDR